MLSVVVDIGAKGLTTGEATTVLTPFPGHWVIATYEYQVCGMLLVL
jgi:hypothetical protein